MEVIAAIAWVATTLFVLFKTSAVYEYLKILPLPDQITHFKEYKKEQEYDFSLSYRLFILINHDTFLNKLFTCPYCLGMWLSVGFSWVFSCLMWIPVVYSGSLIYYFGLCAALLKLEKLEKQENDN